MNDFAQVKWPGWTVTKVIGQGSFGTVYEIQRRVGDFTEVAALKVISLPQNDTEINALRAEHYDDNSIIRYYGESVSKIENEYAIMAGLKGHRNIVYCDDIEKIPHSNGIGWDIYIKMERLTPLKEFVQQSISEYTVILLGIDICRALELCEKRNICHRDIKPENMFVSNDGDFKLGDFGIARTMEGTVSGTKIGTYDYMAPEVYNNQPYNNTTDIYSLGMVMYWLLNDFTGPFLQPRPTPSQKDEARYRRFRGEKLLPPKHGSSELKNIVLRACEFRPENRFPSATEMRISLENILNKASRVNLDSPTGNQPVYSTEGPVYTWPVSQNGTAGGTIGGTTGTWNPPRPQPKPKTNNRKTLIAIVSVAVIVTTAAIILLLSGKDKPEAYTTQIYEISQPSSDAQNNLLEVDIPQVSETSQPSSTSSDYETYPELALTSFYVSPDGVFSPKDGEKLPTQFTIPESKDGITVTCIGYSVLSNREYITDIRLPDTVTRIAGNAFKSCDNLKSISIPAAVNDFANTAFNDCDKLSDIYYGGSQAEWDELCSDFGLTFPSNCTIHFGY